jgi:4-hydroxy-tetrahydrodipicolinate synthase
MLLGGHGNVSVSANIAPRRMHELCKAAMAGDVKRATEIHMGLLSLHRQLFCEASPAPAKWALSQMGRCRNVLRLPLVTLTEAGEAQVGAALRDCGLI